MAKKSTLKERGTGEVLYPVTKAECVITEIIAANGEILNPETDRYYRFDNPVNNLSVVLPSISSLDSLKSIVLSFTTGDSPQVTITADVDIDYFSGYSIEANTSYELNIMFNGSKWIIAYGEVG